MKDRENKIKWLPIVLVLAFLIFSEALFWLGPIQYDVTNNLGLFCYLALLNIALFKGYSRGVTHYKSRSLSLGIGVINLIIIVGFFSCIYSLIYTFDVRGLSVNINTIATALLDSGSAYHTDAIYEQSTTFLTITGPFEAAIIPLGVANWKKISRIVRVIVVLSILFIVVRWLGIGTRKGIFDAFIVLGITVLAYKNVNVFEPSNRKRILLYSIVFGVIFLSYFVISNLSRSGLSAEEIQFVSISSEVRSGYDTLPIWLLYALDSITSYLTQGYYALAKSLEMGILPLSPGGSNWFLINFLKGHGSDPTVGTYMYQLEQFGIDMRINWHTAYVWLANDMTFIGVPFFIYLIGYMFARTWCECVYDKNDISYIMLSFFTISIVYLFANNQLFSFSFIPFFFWLFIYMTQNK